MNSCILTALYRAVLWLWSCLKQSLVYRFLEKVYRALSGAWQSSAIMTLVRGKTRLGETMKNSAAYRFFKIPFNILLRLRRTSGRAVRYIVNRSIILRTARIYMWNVLALNSRFMGLLLLSAFAGTLTASLARGSVPPLGAAIGILGAVMVTGNLNITEFFNNSRVVRFCLNALGFENVSFSFYREERTGGKRAYLIAIGVGFASGLLYFKSILLTAALPIALAGVCIVCYAPVVGVFAAVALAPVVPTMVLAGLCLLTAGAALVKTLTTPHERWILEGVGFGILLLLALLLIASVTGFSPVKSTTVWIMYLVLAGFFFVMITTVKTKEQLMGLCKLFVLVGALVAAYGIMQYLFGWTTSNSWIDEEMFEDSVMRVYSTMENPNVLGEYLLLVLPLSAVFMLRYPTRRLAKWVYTAVFALSALCLVLTQSRGCWLGFMLTAAVFVTFCNGRWWKIAPLFLLILPFIVPQTMVDRLMSIGNMEDSSTSYRVFIWLGTLKMMKDFWVGGIGMGEGAFGNVYPFYSYNAIVAPHSHNTFLQLWVEGGIAALSVFAVTVIIFLKKMYTVYSRRHKRSAQSMLSLAFGAGLAGFLLQSMFDYTFYNYRMMAMFFMFLAMGVILERAGERSGENVQNN